MDSQAVARFYDRTQRWFTWAYSDRQSLGLHYGFWDTTTRNRAEALTNQYRAVSTLLEPQPGEHILDAGCGVGGAALWLSAHGPGHYVGITLSSVQRGLAQRYARQRHLEDQVEFYQMDYRRTAFPNAAFDKVFGIESFCYAYPDLRPLLTEMHRLLTPGGRIVMSDGILRRRPTDAVERQLVGDCAGGYFLSGWNTADEVQAVFRNAGFHELEFIDQTQAIAKSVLDVDRRRRLAGLVLRFLHRLGLASDEEQLLLQATSAQRSAYELGLIGYGIFTGRK